MVKCPHCPTECTNDEELSQHLLAEKEHMRERFHRAQAAVCRYAVAQGPHMADSWKDFLVKECGLVIDEGNPYRHPMVPTNPCIHGPKACDRCVEHDTMLHMST